MDVIKVEETEKDAIIAENGDLELYNTLLSLAEQAQNNNVYHQIAGEDEKVVRNPQVEPYLNVDEFIDYMLINQYVGNTDWDYHNWYAIRKRGGDGFHFVCWDSEEIMGDVQDNVTSNDYEGCPSRIFQGLMKNDIFKQKYQARARQMLEDGGLLSERKVVAVWDSLYHVIENAVYAEAARWGDYRNKVHSYRVELPVFSVEETYMTERNRMLTEYFPNRSNIVIGQLREKGWYHETNNIKSVRANATEGVTYNLSGSPVNANHIKRGDIVIKDGRKFVMKK